MLLKEKFFPSGAVIPPHDHPRAKICLTVGGGCTERREGKSYVHRTWSLQFNPVGSRHTYRVHAGGMRMFSITLESDWSGSLDGSALAPVSQDPGLAALAGRLYREFLQGEAASPAVFEDLLVELIARASGASEALSSRPPGWLNGALERMHDSFREPVSLSLIASQIGVHRSHLARTFRRYVGCTAAEYVRSLRFFHARNLLAETRLPLAEVAVAAGFSDQSHLGRVFQRMAGCTPSQMRRRLRESHAE